MAVDCGRKVQGQGNTASVPAHFHGPAAVLRRCHHSGALKRMRRARKPGCPLNSSPQLPGHPPLDRPLVKADVTQLRRQGTTGVAAGGLRTQTGC